MLEGRPAPIGSLDRASWPVVPPLFEGKSQDVPLKVEYATSLSFHRAIARYDRRNLRLRRLPEQR
jgi:hypothetical protein